MDDLLPSVQFILKGYVLPYRLDRHANGGVLLLLIREHIPSNFLKRKSDCNIKSICVKVNLMRRKWFLNGAHNTNKKFISNHLECLNSIIDEYSKTYQNSLFYGDFNASINIKCMTEFCNLNWITSLIKKPICLKNPDKPACVDRILTNQVISINPLRDGGQKAPPPTSFSPVNFYKRWNYLLKLSDF